MKYHKNGEKMPWGWGWRWWYWATGTPGWARALYWPRCFWFPWLPAGWRWFMLFDPTNFPQSQVPQTQKEALQQYLKELEEEIKRVKSELEKLQ